MMQFDQDRLDFFSMLPGRKTIQIFKDNPACKEYPRFFHTDDLYSNFSWVIKLEDLNALGMGVYCCVNMTDGTGRKKENITKVRAAVADLDGAPLDPVWKYEPTLVVETSPNKYHAWWVADDIPLEGFSQLQKAIAYNLKSDEKVCDLPRVFRVCGFYHMKGEPFLSRIIHYNPDTVHTFRSLQEAFPPAPVEQWSAEIYQKPSEFPTDGEYRGDYGVSKPGRNCHITKRIGGMLKRGLSWDIVEQEAFKEGAACSPMMPEREVLAILKSMRRYV